MTRQDPFWLGLNAENSSDVSLAGDQNRTDAAGVLSWRLPVACALSLHALLFWLISQQNWQPPEQSMPAVVAIDAYFYQPPSRSVTEPESLAAPEPEESEQMLNPTAEAIVETEATKRKLQAELVTAAELAADTATSTEPGAVVEPEAAAARRNLGSQSGTLLERSRHYLQPAEDPALQHRAVQQQQHAQPKITVAPRFQEIPKDPGQQVVAQLDDGQQIIRTRDGCRIADPSKDGFAALMAARRVACGDEDLTDAGQQLQEILQRRDRHSIR